MSKRPRRRWSAEDLATLRALYADTPTAAIAHQLGRSCAVVYATAYQLGLRKSAAFLASPASGRTRTGDTRGMGGRFKPGHTTWNKGTHYVAGGRSAATRFKPGRKPEDARNYLPIGTQRISQDGYLEQKITDDPTRMPARRWVAVHRLVWEAAHGQIPSGHVVCFLPGRRTTVPEQITPDALELVHQRELMRRNSITRYPPALRENIRLLARVKRTIEDRTA